MDRRAGEDAERRALGLGRNPTCWHPDRRLQYPEEDNFMLFNLHKKIILWSNDKNTIFF